MRCPLLLTQLLLLSCANHALATTPWHFADFLQGEWALERTKNNKTSRAKYILRRQDQVLLGNYYEYAESAAADDDEAAATNKMRVNVTFETPLKGSFQLAKIYPKAILAAASADADEAPPPPPPNYIPAFNFSFDELNDGATHISQSMWLGKSGGMLQFIVLSADAFAITHASAGWCHGRGGGVQQIMTWTAHRVGGGGGGRGRSGRSGRGDGRRSLLQKYGPYLAILALYFGYRALRGNGRPAPAAQADSSTHGAAARGKAASSAPKEKET